MQSSRNFGRGSSGHRCSQLSTSVTPSSPSMDSESRKSCDLESIKMTDMGSDSDDFQMTPQLMCSQRRRQRRIRSTFTPGQLRELEMAFSKSQYLTSEMHAALSAKLHLSRKVVLVCNLFQSMPCIYYSNIVDWCRRGVTYTYYL